MKEWKNRTMDIFGTKYKIEFVPKAWEIEDSSIVEGSCNPVTKAITVSLGDFDGKPYSEETIRKNFLHELIHAIFVEGQYLNNTEDEPLVEWTARCINSLIKQKVL